MKTATLRTSGGSLIIAVPAFFTEANHLSAGDQVELTIEGQSMIVRPTRRRLPRYTMEQLLAEHEGDIPRLPEWESIQRLPSDFGGNRNRHPRSHPLPPTQILGLASQESRIQGDRAGLHHG
jgi:antitoxin component of MazEF toxin-antitoxin module